MLLAKHEDGNVTIFNCDDRIASIHKGCISFEEFTGDHQSNYEIVLYQPDLEFLLCFLNPSINKTYITVYNGDAIHETDDPNCPPFADHLTDHVCINPGPERLLTFKDIFTILEFCKGHTYVDNSHTP